MIRVGFHDELERTESLLLRQGQLVRRQLEKVMEALEKRDVDIARAVIEEDDAVDDLYLDVQSGVLNLLALQAPVAKDLRLVSAIVHSNVHVERMGDLVVNIAKFVMNRNPYPSDSPMVDRLREMGQRAAEMIELALAAFSQRSAELAEQLPEKDSVLDRLNRGMLDDLKGYAGDEESFEWALGLILVARYLERMGDHAVDIGEQLAFLVTGVFREFTDASHPELEKERPFVVSQRSTQRPEEEQPQRPTAPEAEVGGRTDQPTVPLEGDEPTEAMSVSPGDDDEHRADPWPDVFRSGS